jgi:hypothetical protein
MVFDSVKGEIRNKRGDPGVGKTSFDGPTPMDHGHRIERSPIDVTSNAETSHQGSRAKRSPIDVTANAETSHQGSRAKRGAPIHAV